MLLPNTSVPSTATESEKTSTPGEECKLVFTVSCEQECIDQSSDVDKSSLWRAKTTWYVMRYAHPPFEFFLSFRTYCLVINVVRLRMSITCLLWSFFFFPNRCRLSTTMLAFLFLSYCLLPQLYRSCCLPVSYILYRQDRHNLPLICSSSMFLLHRRLQVSCLLSPRTLRRCLMNLRGMQEHKLVLFSLTAQLLSSTFGEAMPS